MLAFPNTFVGALGCFDEMAGIAGAIYATVMIAGGALASSLFSSITETDSVPLALTFIIVAIVSWLTLDLIVKSRG